MAISSDLEHLLVRWLPRQRWMPALGSRVGAEPDLTPQSVVRITEVSDGDTGTVQCLLVVLTVRGPLRHTRLCVPLTVRTVEDFSLRSHLVGTVDDLLLGKSYVYDGAADPVFVLALADAIADARSGSSEEFQSSLAGDELPLADTESSPLPQEGRAPADQRSHDEYGVSLLKRAREHRFRRTEGLGSESRVEIDGPDGTYALTILREIGSDNPPAVRYPLALTAVESPTVHPVIGWSHTRWYDDADLTTITAPFALLAHALPGSRRAWRSAAEKVLVVDSGSVGSFNRQASVLGSVVGRLHVDLASEFGRVRGEGDPTRRLVRKWRERVEWALNRAPGALSSLEDRLRAHADGLDDLESIGELQRIHGELTLDHITVGTAEGPRVIGFGVGKDEPRPAEIDLVAMVRSIDYAAGYAWLQRSEALADAEPRFRTLATHGLDDELRDDYLGAPEHLWYRQTANSLLSGYSHARGETTALVDPVLRAALIDRLLVEVVSELRNRPAWLIVPLAALVETLGAGDAVTDGPAAHDPGSDDASSDGSLATASDAAPSQTAGRVPDADDESLRVDGSDDADDEDTVAAGADVLPDRAGIDDDRSRLTPPLDGDEESVAPVAEAPEADAAEVQEADTAEAQEADAAEVPEADTAEAQEADAAEVPETARTEGADTISAEASQADATEVPESDAAGAPAAEAPEGADDSDRADDTDPSDDSDRADGSDGAGGFDGPASAPAFPQIPAKPAWSPSAAWMSGSERDLPAGGVDDAAGDDADDEGLDDEAIDEDGAGDDETDAAAAPRSARTSRGSAD